MIRAVDEEIVNVFSAAFADVSENFVALFDTLFPGGQGRLRLTEPHDLLNTGIELEARPSGKNVKKLSLLSGGERSLTALAYLFAVFRSRPSPFYVMDEVEAALDDVNLHRFLGLVAEFRAIGAAHHRQPPEADDGSGRRAVRRHHGAGRFVEGAQRAGRRRPRLSARRSGRFRRLQLRARCGRGRRRSSVVVVVRRSRMHGPGSWTLVSSLACDGRVGDRPSQQRWLSFARLVVGALGQRLVDLPLGDLADLGRRSRPRTARRRRTQAIAATDSASDDAERDPSHDAARHREIGPGHRRARIPVRAVVGTTVRDQPARPRVAMAATQVTPGDVVCSVS